MTAGLFLLLKFDYFIFFFELTFCLLFFGLLTIIFSSLRALLEEDLKKVVALRTLSQMGFLIIILGLNYFFFSYLHIVRHALFKSCLFIQVGFIIHNSFSQQDGRLYNIKFSLPYFIQFQILLTLFCLIGLFFRRGIIRKDLILEAFYFLTVNFFLGLLFLFSVYLTFFYSFRL